MADSSLYLVDDVDAIERGELDRWVHDAGGDHRDLVVLPDLRGAPPHTSRASPPVSPTPATPATRRAGARNGSGAPSASVSASSWPSRPRCRNCATVSPPRAGIPATRPRSR